MNASPPTRLSLRKKLLFALIPLCVLLMGTELGLRGIGYPSPSADPYQSFVLHRPLFEPHGEFMQTNPARADRFRQQEFLRLKPAGTIRCVVAGGSVTYGYGLTDPAHEAYPYVLSEQVEKAHPQSRFEIINCGGMAYATYRLVGIVQECLSYDPDLVIVMSGHNEFLEPRLYASLLQNEQSIWSKSRIVRALQQWSAKRAQQNFKVPQTGDEQHMVLAADFIREEFVVRDAGEYASTAEHFTHNLREMIRMCRERGVPIILCTEASNLRDWPPFVTLRRGSPDEAALNAELGRLSRMVSSGRFAEALEISEKVLRDDPHAAAFHFVAAKCLDALGKPAEAKPHYIQARDTDGFPHRSITLLNDAVRSLAKAENVPLFDAEQALMAAARDGIPGADLFSDQCHPNAAGHAIIAAGLRECIATRLPGVLAAK